jgi:sterol desaturase/sphingolipid hydroxylase (fatty acid hydroxylase superfamily)
MAIALAAAWLAVAGLDELGGAGSAGKAISAVRGDMVGPALLIFTFAIAACEWRWPAAGRPALSRAHIVDAGYFLTFAILVVPVLILVQTGFAVEVQTHARFLMLGRISAVPKVLVVSMILVAMDAMNWLAHVANHRSAALWRLHALHHSQRDMSVFTTFRTHPLVHATYLLSAIPALMLGASGTVPAAALIAYGCLVTLPHANLRWTFGPAGKVLVSPAYHRLHHSRSPLGPTGTVNFGFVLVAWDRLARVAMFPNVGPPVETGIDGNPVPVEQDGGASEVPGVILAQLLQPFAPRARTDPSL